MHAPSVTMLAPRPQAYSIDADHPLIHLKVKVEDPDDVLTGVPTQAWRVPCVKYR